jgi:hypothetical protein
MTDSRIVIQLRRPLETVPVNYNDPEGLEARSATAIYVRSTELSSATKETQGTKGPGYTLQRTDLREYPPGTEGWKNHEDQIKQRQQNQSIGKTSLMISAIHQQLEGLRLMGQQAGSDGRRIQGADLEVPLGPLHGRWNPLTVITGMFQQRHCGRLISRCRRDRDSSVWTDTESLVLDVCRQDSRPSDCEAVRNRHPLRRSPWRAWVRRCSRSRGSSG